MRLKREVMIGIGAILVLQVLLSMLAIILLIRMGPAVERILQENVYSSKAVEDMVALLATEPKGHVPGAFQKALERAENNVTEQAEKPLIAAIKRLQAPAFKGDRAARIALTRALTQLGQVNRNSMAKADKEAKGLGFAGAWAFAFLGALALALGVMVYRRLRIRLDQPIDELYETTQRARDGNLWARCPPNNWPHEIKQMALNINWLLDRLSQESYIPGSLGREEREAAIRRSLLWCLEQESDPALILDANDHTIMLSKGAMSLPQEAHDALRGEEKKHWELTSIPDTDLRLALYTQAPQKAPRPTQPSTAEEEQSPASHKKPKPKKGPKKPKKKKKRK